MDAGLRPSDVACTGITGITAADVSAAKAAGERWKLIAEVRRTPAGVVVIGCANAFVGDAPLGQGPQVPPMP
jgi:homoserine dehydrogenase